MLNDLPGIYFLDIESVAEKPFNELDPSVILLFEKRFRKEILERTEKNLNQGTKENFEGDLEYDHQTLMLHREKAGLTAEFGKIICISIGTLVKVKSEVEGGTDVPKFFIKTFANSNEKVLLTEFAASMEKAKIICGHNSEEFDFPFITRRMIVHGIPLPEILRTFGVKVWDVRDKHLDTMKMWSAGAFNHRVSLNLLCNVLGIPFSKEELSGDRINDLYWSIFKPSDELPFDKEERIMKQIGDYCAADMFATALCYCRLKGLDMIDDTQIEYR